MTLAGIQFNGMVLSSSSPTVFLRNTPSIPTWSLKLSQWTIRWTHNTKQNSSTMLFSEQNFEQNTSFLQTLPKGVIRRFTRIIYPSLPHRSSHRFEFKLSDSGQFKETKYWLRDVLHAVGRGSASFAYSGSWNIHCYHQIENLNKLTRIQLLL